MIRLLGAISGSALALATLLVLIGIPQFKAAPSTIDRAVVTLPQPTAPVESPAPESPAAPPLDEPQSPATTAETVADPAPADAAAPPDDVVMAEAPLPIDEPESATEPVLESSEQWYAFWSPFRSELAASGFVDQLSRVTGLDYRVVKVKPGVYEVAFAYRDDAEIVDSLSRITAATGLDMPGAE